MIPLRRKQIKTIRSVFRAALGLGPRAGGPLLQFQTGNDGLSISGSNSASGIRFQIEGSFPDVDFTLPFDFLADSEGSTNDAVLINVLASGVEAQWTADSVPQTRTYDLDNSSEATGPPDLALTTNPVSLLSALSEATQTCDSSSTRYALDCIQLRGSTGSIAATDSRQLFVESGFSFPWNDDVLLPASRLFRHREWLSHDDIAIGRTDDVIILQSGPWTIWRKIETKRRFPDVDSVVPEVGRATSTVTISAEDGRFLSKAVPQLPTDDIRHEAVTVDLNGSIAVRSRAIASQSPTELVLSHSTRMGEQVRFCTDRRLLSRAVQLGFDRLHIFGPERPVVCESQQRRYVWMLLDKEGAIKPSKHSTRIESASATSTSDNPTSSPESHKAMSRRNNRNTSRSESSTTEPDTSTSPIDRAESLRSHLQAALADVRELITALKEQRKHSRTVQSALKSLRELETVEV